MFVLLCSSVCPRYVGCWHVPVLGGPAFALVFQKKKLIKKEHCRLSVSPIPSLPTSDPHPEGRAGQLAPILVIQGASRSRPLPFHPGGLASIPEVQPGSPIAPQGSLSRVWEGNQVLEQMAGPSKTESGGGGYLALANRRQG